MEEGSLVSVETDEIVDVEQWLDRSSTHAHCTICQNGMAGALVIALCGVLKRCPTSFPGGVPADRCDECAVL